MAKDAFVKIYMLLPNMDHLCLILQEWVDMSDKVRSRVGLEQIEPNVDLVGSISVFL